MLVSDFDFDLSSELIAQFPPKNRSDARLLVLQNQQISDRKFTDFISYLQPNDIIVRNNTKVIPARLFGHKTTGGKVELMLERILDDGCLLAQLKSSKSPKIAGELVMDGGFRMQVVKRQGSFFVLSLIQSTDGNQTELIDLFKQFGQIPLPPYIDRQAKSDDQNRYQTIYARAEGAVAAPTAGLHFDANMLNRIKQAGIPMVDLTLHVGAGTFQPVRAETLAEHQMHKEWFEISDATCAQINTAKANGGRVVAIGTTSLRALESAARTGKLTPQSTETDIFITPGYDFQIVDVLLTNFHLPQSTLLMLVSAFAGIDEIKHAYTHAIAQKYRFFSYGDAMLLHQTEN